MNEKSRSGVSFGASKGYGWAAFPEGRAATGATRADGTASPPPNKTDAPVSSQVPNGGSDPDRPPSLAGSAALSPSALRILLVPCLGRVSACRPVGVSRVWLGFHTWLPSSLLPAGTSGGPAARMRVTVRGFESALRRRGDATRSGPQFLFLHRIRSLTNSLPPTPPPRPVRRTGRDPLQLSLGSFLDLARFHRCRRAPISRGVWAGLS